jgi:hypothetical protein
MTTVSIQQIPSSHGNGETTWNIEDKWGDNYVITRNWNTGKFSAEYIDWSEEKQDWVGVSVKMSDIKHLLPEALYS